jgi:hypothetical protein
MSTWVSTMRRQQYRFRPKSSNASLCESFLPLGGFLALLDAHRFLLLNEVEVIPPTVANDLVSEVYLAAGEAANWNQHLLINFQKSQINMNDDSFGAAPRLPSDRNDGWPVHLDESPFNGTERNLPDRFGDPLFENYQKGGHNEGYEEEDGSDHFDLKEIRTCIAIAEEDQLKSLE